MIKSFKTHETSCLFNNEKVSKLAHIETVARRKLVMLNAASNLNDLTIPPRNMLEKLSGNRKGQYSIRINDQYRICFRWEDGDAFDVEVVDYHR